MPRLLALFTAVLLAAVLPATAQTPAEAAAEPLEGSAASGSEASAEPVVHDPAAAEAGVPLAAQIRRTSEGIAHITADDYAGVGYGYGYAIARDNLCVLADTYVTVSAERSRFFGPDETYRFQGNGKIANNLDSDFFFAQINAAGTVEELVAQSPPDGPVDEARELVRGYVAGYNRYLRDIGGADGVDDPACAGAEWVREITELDAYRRFYQLALLASAGVAINGIGGAQPPTPSLFSAGEDDEDRDLQVALDLLRDPDFEWPSIDAGSNAYGIGSDGTADGTGMLLGNPHFPWQGSERFWQSHLTIPGTMDVAGGSLFGVPLILIGHTRDMAWSHTVSTAFRFTPFELTLVPGSPTTYLVDGEPRTMEEWDLEVEVRDEDGELSTETRTLYRTDFGPVMTSILGLPVFPWTPTTAFAMGDVNEANFRYLNHFFDKNHASSVREVLDILETYQGIPWVNTIAADSAGEGLYADIGAIPHVTDDKIDDCNTLIFGELLVELAGLPVLDGSDSDCTWGSAPDAAADGIFGPANLPRLIRTDFVANSNDSYWLSNPDEPLEGFARIIGDERTQRSLRTRLGITMAQEEIAAGGFTLDRLTEVAFNNRNLSAELARADVVAMCRSQIEVDDEACDVLEAWDTRVDRDSEGAHVWREFWANAAGSPGLWSDSFDADDPVNTPRELETNNPAVREALADAVSDIQSADVDLDARLGALQTEARGDERIEIHGGPHAEGIFNMIVAPVDSDTMTYPDVIHGSSFVIAAELDGSDCPDVRTLLTYSQSTDPSSPFYADQTHRYSDKDWVHAPFCEDDIAADPNLEVTDLREDARVVRVAGDDRVETAVAVSQQRFADTGAVTVVLARSTDYPDALAGAPLAHALDAPLLLTPTSFLHEATAAEISRLGAERVLLLGGTAALSPETEQAVRELGVDVERVQGENRFATAAAIARRLGAAGGSAVIAEGAHADARRGWPDALAAAPFAAFTDRPVLLVTANRLPDETAAALTELDVEETVVVGGPVAVGDEVVAGLEEHGPRRVFGETRYETSAAVHAEAVSAGMDAEFPWLATGANFPDALAAGPTIASLGHTLLLVAPRNLDSAPPTRDALEASTPRVVRILGGPAAVSDVVEQQVRVLVR